MTLKPYQSNHHIFKDALHDFMFRGDNPNVFWDETLYINLLLHEVSW